MTSSYNLIFRVAFEHTFSADGILRSLRIVPDADCHDMLRKAGVLLRVEDDGIAAYGDAATMERLYLHIAQSGGPLKMAFEVFATDPNFFEYTLPAWPRGKLLLLDTSCAVADDIGRQMLHATPYVTANAFVDRDQAVPARGAGTSALTPSLAMLLQVTVSTALLDEPDEQRRYFHARFDAASSHWKYWLFGAEESDIAVVDLAGDVAFDRFKDVGIGVGDRRRADVFLSRREIPMREAPPSRFQLRAVTAAGDKVLVNRLPNASLGRRIGDRTDGNEIRVSEIFIHQSVQRK